MPIRPAVLVLCVLLCASGATAVADDTSNASLEARMKALEQRVSDLEARLAAQSAPASAARPAVTVVPHVVKPGEPTPQAAWSDPSKWAQLKQGMSWSEVRKLLGAPGHTTTGVFGEVWYYPDDSGGRVVFDRDSRVAEIDPPSAR
jgi:hypothetical protein